MNVLDYKNSFIHSFKCKLFSKLKYILFRLFKVMADKFLDENFYIFETFHLQERCSTEYENQCTTEYVTECQGGYGAGSTGQADCQSVPVENCQSVAVPNCRQIADEQVSF